MEAPLLYEVSGELVQLLARLEAAPVDEDGEVQAPADLMDAIGELRLQLPEAVEAVAGRIQAMELLAEGVQKEAARLEDRAEKLLSRADRLRESIRKALIATNTKQVKGAKFTVGLKEAPPRVDVVNRALVPVEWLSSPKPPPPIAEWAVNKAEAGKAMKSGLVIPGLALGRNEPGLVIK